MAWLELRWCGKGGASFITHKIFWETQSSTEEMKGVFPCMVTFYPSILCASCAVKTGYFGINKIDSWRNGTIYTVFILRFGQSVWYWLVHDFTCPMDINPLYIHRQLSENRLWDSSLWLWCFSLKLPQKHFKQPAVELIHFCGPISIPPSEILLYLYIGLYNNILFEERFTPSHQQCLKNRCYNYL